MWLACYTQQEIADEVGIPQQSVKDVLTENGNIAKLGKPQQSAAQHDDGVDEDGEPRFKIPLYNVWKQQTKTEGVNHFGNSESRWLDNLLYTKPFLVASAVFVACPSNCCEAPCIALQFLGVSVALDRG